MLIHVPLVLLVEVLMEEPLLGVPPPVALLAPAGPLMTGLVLPVTAGALALDALALAGADVPGGVAVAVHAAAGVRAGVDEAAPAAGVALPVGVGVLDGREIARAIGVVVNLLPVQITVGELEVEGLGLVCFAHG